MGARNERFVTVYDQGTLENTKIVVDKETGVNYLYHKCGNSGGLTPLIDEDGKPIISKLKE
ncbi:DUF6440 family protein [Lachnospiraceae bacterium ZAX-1]